MKTFMEKEEVTYGDIIQTFEKYRNLSKADFEQLAKAEKSNVYYEIVTTGNAAVQYNTGYAESMRQLFNKLFC